MDDAIRSPYFSDPFVYPAVEEDQWFDSPFLAPRGICAVDDWLFLTDTAQNQIFCWRTDPGGKPIDDSLILLKARPGDPPGSASASSLQYPSGIWSDGNRLIVADAWNHRLLIWHSMPTADSQPADRIIGQAGPADVEINRSGDINAPRADSLYWPYGIHCDGTSLWIADTGNRRILYYETLPATDGAPATAVLGQAGFQTRDHNSRYLPWPYSVKVSPTGEMLVADPSTFRVTYWTDWHRALGCQQTFDLVLGQGRPEETLQNRGRFAASATSMNWCYDAHFFRGGILAADTGNSRLLHWTTLPKIHGAPADYLLGQDSFKASAESSSLFHQRADNFYWPFSTSLTNKHLWIADTGNNRIVRYRMLGVK
jgi:hypothetical protein